MKLVNFSVTNFRSITTAHKIPISETTVLIGLNNEGKSNLLKALSIAMEAIQEHSLNEMHRRIRRRPSYRRSENTFFWDRDFPIALQDRKGQKVTVW
ncbi:MAG: AAA family ATPase [Chromatiales bacterium]|nr:AAA family ATPase [Gammaproteobacteria bacterium]